MPLKILLLLLFCAGLAPTFAGDAPPLFSDENMQFDFASGLARRRLDAEAVAEFTKFIDRYPQSAKIAVARGQRAEAEFNLGDYAAAAGDYAAFLAGDGATLHYALRYAICLGELQRHAEALQVLRPWLTHRDKELPAANYYAGLAARESDQPAQPYFQAAIDAGDAQISPLALYALGETQRRQEQWTLAAATFSTLAARYPDHELAPAALLATGEISRQTGDFAAAVSIFHSLADAPDAPLRRRARYELAVALADLKRTDEARHYAALVANDPNAGEFHDRANFLLATLYFAQKRYVNADVALRKISAAAEFADRAATLALWNAYEQHDYAAVLRLAALDKFSANEDFRYLAGRAAYALGDYPAAARNFLAARDLRGKRAAEAGLEAALAWEKSGDAENAVAAYEWLRQNAPERRDAGIGLGRTLMNARRYEAALRVWEELSRDEQLTAEQRENVMFQQAAAFFYLRQFGNLRAAGERLLAEFPQGPNAPEAWFWLAWRDLEDQQFAAALAKSQEFLRRYPAHRLAGQARYYSGVALLKLERADEAADIFYQVVAGGGTLTGEELLWLAGQMRARHDATRAAEIFTRIIDDEKAPLLRVAAALGLADLRRAEKKWDEALALARQVETWLPQIGAPPPTLTALNNEMNLGLTVAARHLGDLATAERTLARITVAPDDANAPRLYYERGMLAAAQKKYAEAAELLMRVGLLSGDAELAGAALWEAAQACVADNDAHRAQICYEELAGELNDSFGRRFPNSEYVKRARAELERAINN
ncbi:MAG: tetratricopeptide repeat protein [Planctomycetota bacterium]|jgi:TolA-binding protein|nr:tetratricopeptide repeat protein [Planctomycetota bacterium]